MHRGTQKLVAVVFAWLALASTGMAQHTGDLWVGRSASGQLKLDTVCEPSCGFDPSDNLTILTPDEFGGFSNDAPGFDRITADQPAEDTFRLAAGAQIRLQVVELNEHPSTPADLAIAPALLIYDPLAFTFYPYAEAGGLYREISLGTYQLHKHVVWFLDAMDPAYDPTRCTWEVTLRLIDKGTTGYSPSEPFTLRFALHEPVPGDFDCDRDVDADDLAAFTACQGGPAMPLTDSCSKFDLDGDADADGTDFAIIQRCWTGPDRVGDPACRG